jgi:mannose-6-phosphate isomerase-like protein (cupin superfamily)
MATGDKPTSAYAVVDPDDVENHYDGSDVPGEFRSLTAALGCNQLAVTLIRVPAHSDFEQGTGHFHDEIEELYLLTRGTLTMRFREEIERVSAPAAVRVAHDTPRSHRNEGGEPVEMWAISRKNAHGDATKLDDFWDASPEAKQHSDGP